MRKFFIVIAGLYIAALGIIEALLMLAGFWSLSGKGALSAETGAHVLYGIAINVFFSICLLATGIGLIFRKNWSRYSLFIMSALSIFIGIISCIMVLLIPFPVNTPETAVHLQTGRLIITSFIFAIFIILPILFVLFFSRKSVKELFINAGNIQQDSGHPFGVTFVVIMSLIGAILSVPLIFFNMYSKFPLIGNIFLSGMGIKIYFLVTVAINLYIAWGLFKLRKTAWIVCIIFNIFYIITGAINIFSMSAVTLSQVMPASTTRVDFSGMMPFFKIAGSFGLIIPVIMLIYIVSKRKLFLK